MLYDIQYDNIIWCNTIQGKCLPLGEDLPGRIQAAVRVPVSGGRSRTVADNNLGCRRRAALETSSSVSSTLNLRTICHKVAVQDRRVPGTPLGSFQMRALASASSRFTVAFRYCNIMSGGIVSCHVIPMLRSLRELCFSCGFRARW